MLSKQYSVHLGNLLAPWSHVQKPNLYIHYSQFQSGYECLGSHISWWGSNMNLMFMEQDLWVCDNMFTLSLFRDATWLLRKKEIVAKRSVANEASETLPHHGVGSRACNRGGNVPRSSWILAFSNPFGGLFWHWFFGLLLHSKICG